MFQEFQVRRIIEYCRVLISKGEKVMVQKSVSDLIFDKFTESIEKDVLFKGISTDLAALVRGKKRSKTEFQNLLRKKQDEDSKPRN